MIKGSRINLRHVRRNDLEQLVSLLNDLDARGEYLPNTMFSPVDLQKKFEADGMAGDDLTRFLIVDGSDRILGTIFYFKSVPYYSAREIGYTIFAVDQRGAGIATEAVTLLSRHLFDLLQINRLEIRMDSRNLASEKVAIKCGFKKEGVSRGANFIRGKHVDMNIYALLRNEFDV
ncbi:MAG: GNAT family N-acetyltransferase [Burkholderiaceae bacterium]|nr:GNAT family N-acetyltransferase [Burkholderiaceae bacterium]